jgi:rSAM/selenodomain-associated transferase 2
MTISVVIPTLDEEAAIAAAVAGARRALGDCEVIVVDAGSHDGTAAAAAADGATVVTAPGSRAEAMNRGAAVATGDVLLFLHADTLLPEGAAAAVAAALTDADAGAFRIRFDRPRPALERLVNVRSRLFKVVYGDQALFVTRAAFERAGGFRPIPIMEDFDLVRRLRRQGGLVVLPAAVTTSGRRHQQSGRARTLVRIWLIQLLYLLRVPPERLARLYPPVR